MYLQNLPKEVEGGAMVTNVDSNSAASKAGLASSRCDCFN